jgi:hypothetical protein
MFGLALVVDPEAARAWNQRLFTRGKPKALITGQQNEHSN